MKFLAVLCFLSVFALDAVTSQGIPTRDCPPGEHTVLYCPQVLERTCDLPERPNDYDYACDIPDCFCNTGTVRHSGSGKCVHPKDC